LENDQFHKGSWVFLAHGSTPHCQVKIVEKFLRIANHSKGSTLFQHVLHTKRGVSMSKEAKSYTWAKELIKKELDKEGLDPTTFGIHSL